MKKIGAVDDKAMKSAARSILKNMNDTLKIYEKKLALPTTSSMPTISSTSTISYTPTISSTPVTSSTPSTMVNTLFPLQDLPLQVHPPSLQLQPPLQFQASENEFSHTSDTVSKCD